MFPKFSVICVIFVLSSIDCWDELTTETPVDYSRHKLIKIYPKKSDDLNVINKLRDKYKMDFWNPTFPDLRPVLTLVNPSKLGEKFLWGLNESNINYKIKSDNFQDMIDKEKFENEDNNREFRQTFDYDSTYHKYDEINNELIRITKNNSKATYGTVGKTYENRTIPFVTITNPEVKNKKSVILECGIHAREWISPSTCLWIINNLLSDPQNEPLLKKFEFNIIPTLNPDGYVYTHTTNRMWRKTRSVVRIGRKTTIGVDPNRNFDSNFGGAGTSRDPSGESYCGPKAFSEVETRAMADFMLKKRGNIAAYFAIHAYSQLWMYPYGYTNNPAPNAGQLEQLSTHAVNAIRQTNGLTFKKGSIAKAIYLASGSSIDWAYDAAGVKASFALELRDQGQYGFMLPPNQIKATAVETWAGIKAVVNNL